MDVHATAKSVIIEMETHVHADPPYDIDLKVGDRGDYLEPEDGSSDRGEKRRTRTGSDSRLNSRDRYYVG